MQLKCWAVNKFLSGSIQYNIIWVDIEKGWIKINANRVGRFIAHKNFKRLMAFH